MLAPNTAGSALTDGISDVYKTRDCMTLVRSADA